MLDHCLPKEMLLLMMTMMMNEVLVLGGENDRQRLTSAAGSGARSTVSSVAGRHPHARCYVVGGLGGGGCSSLPL
jgi:hypothetical protein